MQNCSGDRAKDAMRANNKGRRARHVIVIAGASGSGKTELIRKLSRPPRDAFTTKVLKQLDCNPHQNLKRSTVERMQRLMHPANFKKRKTRKLKYCLLLHIDLTSINHDKNLMLLNQISARTKRLDVITLYTSPEEWRQRIIDRLHTENEPSMRAALIALSARLSSSLSNLLYHREYTKWMKALKNYEVSNSCLVNTFEEKILTTIPRPPRDAQVNKNLGIQDSSPRSLGNEESIIRFNDIKNGEKNKHCFPTSRQIPSKNNPEGGSELTGLGQVRRSLDMLKRWALQHLG